MENVHYEHAVSYFVIIAEIKIIDDSVERKQNLTSTSQQLYCQFSVCYRMQFPEVDFQFCFVHVLFWHYYPNALCHDLFVTQSTDNGKRYPLS